MQIHRMLPLGGGKGNHKSGVSWPGTQEVKTQEVSNPDLSTWSPVLSERLLRLPWFLERRDNKRQVILVYVSYTETRPLILSANSSSNRVLGKLLQGALLQRMKFEKVTWIIKLNVCSSFHLNWKLEWNVFWNQPLQISYTSRDSSTHLKWPIMGARIVERQFCGQSWRNFIPDDLNSYLA